MLFNWSEFHLSEMTLLQNPYFSYVTRLGEEWGTGHFSKVQYSKKTVTGQEPFLGKHDILKWL